MRQKHERDSVMTPSISLVTYILNEWMNGLLLKQNPNKNIRIKYSLKCKHLKINLFEKINDSVVWNKHSGINEKPNSTMPVLVCRGTSFTKKNSCLVATIL